MKPLSFIAGLCVAFVVSSGPAWAQETKAKTDKPNILVIWGDDIGWQNVSAYGMGTMGYTTPNIDKIGNEGIKFTDHYAQPSCHDRRRAGHNGDPEH